MFTSRKTQFVPDAHGKPIRADVYRAQTALAKKRQNQAQEFFKQIENFIPPSSDIPIRQMTASQESDHPELYNPSANPTRKLGPKESKNFTSEKAVKKYTDSLKQQTKRGYLKTIRKQGMPVIDAALGKSETGRQLLKRIRSLTDEQFGVMWTVRSYIDAVSQFYELEKALGGDTDLPFSEDAMRSMQADALSEMKTMVSDSEAYQKQPTKASRGKGKKRR
jgi:hypothetical protein